MASSQATTVAEYLAELPPDRSAVVAAVRDVVVRNLPMGYEEHMHSGMISYEIPLATYPNTYNGQPLGYAALTAQKNYYALYLMGCYVNSEQVDALQAAYDAMGKRMDMGKSCLRFKRIEDVPLDVVGQLVASTPPEAYIAAHESARAK